MRIFYVPSTTQPVATWALLLFLLVLVSSPQSVLSLKCGDATSCDSCLNEAVPTADAAVESCTWFQDIGFCEEGCGMNGCGASICASDASTCQQCLGFDETRNQYAWSPATNECVPSCRDAPADASCFPGSTYDESICDDAGVAAPIPPGEGCQAATDCATCMMAAPASANFCTWFEDIGYCEEGCGMDGCGASFCAADASSCRQCLGLDAKNQYAWSPDTNECVASCMDAPADAACFAGTDYDESVCPAPTTCEDCLGSSGDYAWVPDADECVMSCVDAPADAACFPSSNYDAFVCLDTIGTAPLPVDAYATSSVGPRKKTASVIAALMIAAPLIYN